jgi:hypothetical protein
MDLFGSALPGHSETFDLRVGSSSNLGRDRNTTLSPFPAIVVDERPKIGKNRQQRGYLSTRLRTKVAVHSGYHEGELGDTVKQAGAVCSEARAWVMSYSLAVTLGLTDRIRKPRC